MQLTYIFGKLNNMYPTKYGMNTIHNLLTGHSKEFGYIGSYRKKLIKIYSAKIYLKVLCVTIFHEELFVIQLH